MGVEALADYLVKEMQEVYRLQGVKINDKHIEVIVRQMLQKVGDRGGRRHHAAEGRAGGQDRSSTRRTRRRSPKGAKPATGAPMLLGITKASLQTRSLHLRGLVPGDDARADRGGVPGQGATSSSG